MGDIRLRLEDRAHERGQPGIELEHLLELVEDDAYAPLPFGRQLRRELQEPLERRVDVLARVAAGEAEPSDPSFGSTVITGAIRRLRKTCTARSRARKSGVAISS